MAKGKGSQGKTARVQKGYATGGLPGVTGAGSPFTQAKVTIANPGLVKANFDAGKGAIGNGSGIPAGAK